MRTEFRVQSNISGMEQWDTFSAELTRLVDSDVEEISLDMQNVTRLSSLALGSIVAAHNKMAEGGRRLVVENVGDELEKLLRATKVYELLHHA